MKTPAEYREMEFVELLIVMAKLYKPKIYVEIGIKRGHTIKRMAPFVAKSSLAEGFKIGIPFFASMGMEMDIVDISNRGSDAALEIQKYCPYLEISKEYGFETPCHIVCEMDIEAIRRAFPEMNGEILARQAAGSSVCIFKYERPAK